MKPRNNIQFLQQVAKITVDFYDKMSEVLSDKELLDYIKSDQESFHTVIIGLLLSKFRNNIEDVVNQLNELDLAYDQRFIEGLDLI